MKPQCRHREWEDQTHLWEGMQGPLWWEAWGPVRKLLQYFCLGVLQSEEGLGWRRPKSKSFLDLLKHKLPPVAGPSHMLCPKLFAKNQPIHKTKRYDYMSLTEERMESSSGPGCFNTGPAGLLARVWSNSLKMTPRNVAWGTGKTGGATNWDRGSCV